MKRILNVVRYKVRKSRKGLVQKRSAVEMAGQSSWTPKEGRRRGGLPKYRVTKMSRYSTCDLKDKPEQLCDSRSDARSNRPGIWGSALRWTTSSCAEE